MVPTAHCMLIVSWLIPGGPELVPRLPVTTIAAPQSRLLCRDRRNPEVEAGTASTALTHSVVRPPVRPKLGSDEYRHLAEGPRCADKPELMWPGGRRDRR